MRVGSGAALLIASALMLAACGQSEPAIEDARNFDDFTIRLGEGTIALQQTVEGEAVVYTAFTGTDGPQEAEIRIARTNQEWSALLADVPRAPRRGLAEGQLGVGVFLGMRPTGGYSLEVDSVLDSEGTLYVLLQEIAPKPDEIVTQALTYPWAVLIIETAPEGDPVIRVLKPGVVKPEQ